CTPGWWPSGTLGYLYQHLGAVGWTSLPWLRLIQQPTLILHGDDDPIVPLANSKIRHRLILHSQLYIFHDGHLGLGTRAEELSRVIGRFFGVRASTLLAGPPPVGDLRRIYAILHCVGHMLDNLVAQPLLHVGAGPLQPRHAINHIDGEIEAIDLVQDS